MTQPESANRRTRDRVHATAGLAALVALLAAVVACGGDTGSDSAELGRLKTQVAAATIGAGQQRTAAAGPGHGDPTPTPQPTAEATRSSPATPVPAQGVGRSRSNPAPKLTAMQIGDWLVGVNSVIPNSNELVANENMFNDAPRPGVQFYMVNVSATYTGTKEPAQFFSGPSLKLVGASSVSYDYSNGCGVIPSELDRFKDVFKGGTLLGNLCWAVEASDVSSVVMFGTESFSFDDTTYWWAVQP